jgi:arylsulfatase A-like enzyme
MASMLKSVDECFGRILAELDKQGIADNTIVIFNSDNGGNTHSNITSEGKKSASEEWVKWAGSQPPTMNTPLRDGKGTLYDGGTRVPLMWSWAGQIQPGSTSDAVVGPIDLYPTIIDLISIPKPDNQIFDGVSYASILRGEGGLKRQAYFNYHPHAGLNKAGGVWVRSSEWKLLRWFGNPATHELYNLKDDLSEAHDLAAIMPDKVKAIVIGERGAQLKAIATAARHDMEALFGCKVFMELWVKIQRIRARPSASEDIALPGDPGQD